MSWIRECGDQLGRPWRALRECFPFSFSGRQTLIYLLFGLSGPALTALTWWAMRTAEAHGWTALFQDLADKIALCLLISTLGLAMFVSIRSFKLGKDGIEAQSDPNDGGENANDHGGGA